MSSLLVIGGSGFFGKSILDSYKRGLLSNTGIDRIAILSRSAKSLENSNPELIRDDITLIESDISRCEYLPSADYVIHAAASTDARNYLNASSEEKANILSGIKNYCSLAEKFH